LTAQQGLLPALMYLPLPVAIWAAVRFGAKGASGAVLIVTALTIWPALNGVGMFVGADAEHNVLDLQLFLIAMSLPLLLLAASVDGARTSEHLARQLARALLAAQDDARRRIGRDLHQSIAQTLVEAAQCAEEAQRVAPQASGILRHLKQLVLQSNRKVREVSHFLHPPLLDEAGLETALAQYVDDYSDRNRVKVRLEVSPSIGRLSADVELALFRLVEEALETVRKQSQDPSLLVKIELETTSADREVLLTVESVSADGAAAGPPPLFSLKTPMGRTHSMAIASMRERLSRVGGLVRLDSAAGRVVVRATVPVAGGT
jgi:signal transduction histidine kinase